MTEIWEVLLNECVLVCACAHVRYSCKWPGKFGNVCVKIGVIFKTNRSQHYITRYYMWLPLWSSSTQMLEVISVSQGQNQSESVLHGAMDG